MKTFACGAVVPNCTATFESETEAGLLVQVADHACTAHGIDAVPPELVAAVQRNIVTR